MNTMYLFHHHLLVLLVNCLLKNNQTKFMSLSFHRLNMLSLKYKLPETTLGLLAMFFGTQTLFHSYALDFFVKVTHKSKLRALIVALLKKS